MKKFVFFLSILFACSLVQAQDIDLPDVDILDVPKSFNISVGKHSLLACYPEVEFLVRFDSMELWVTRTDSVIRTPQVFEVITAQVRGNIYTAEINPTQWVEIDTQAGTTLVHQHCWTQVFTPSIHAQKSKPNGCK